MAKVHDIVPCLWFENQAEEAAKYYSGIFKTGRVTKVTRYSEVGHEAHHRPSGSVMTVEFEINGKTSTALNGGPEFKFNEAISLQVMCEDQKEVDYYWEKLRAGGDPGAQICGWLKDKYGLSWQVAPRKMVEWFGEPNEKSERAMAAMLQMSKLDIAVLEKAYNGS